MSEPVLKKPRIGQRQRLNATNSHEDATRSALALHLEEQWAWGYLSPQAIQKIAHLAIEDMKTAGTTRIPGDLAAIARIGSSGTFSNNCNRDLQTFLPQKSMVPMPLQEHISFKNGKHLQSLLLPHEMFHVLFHKYKKYWTTCFVTGGSDRLVKFWKGFESHPSMASSNLKNHPSYPKKMVPIGMHGDAVPTTAPGKAWCKMQLCLTWHSILKSGGSKATSFLMWSVARLFEQHLLYLYLWICLGIELV